MNTNVRIMIEEHANALKRINANTAYFNSAVKNDKVSKITAANVALLIRDYKNLAETLEVCLYNEGIEFTPDGKYFENIAEINTSKKNG
jgi:hypothetical protein